MPNHHTSIIRWLLLFTFFALCSVSSQAQNRRPNILIAMADDLAWPYLGAYGAKFVNTPAFDRIAREGVLFTHCYAASPGCSPSRAALLTGRHTWQIKEAGTHASSFPTEFKVFPDLLEESGYQVGFTGKGWGPGNFEISERKRNPAGEAWNKHHLKGAPPGTHDEDYAANFQDFLKARKPGQPFYFWYGGHEPHQKHDTGSGLRKGKKLTDITVPPFLPDTREVRSDLLDYAVETEHFDQHLGLMVEALAAAGELDNTLILVTADNGMPYPRGKANLYDAGTHEPLAIRWPARVKGGRTVNDLIGFVDFAPTLLEATGLKPTAAMSGRSFLNILTSTRAGRVDARRDQVFIARERHSSARVDNLGYPARALRTHEFLYIRNFAPDRWPAGDPRPVKGDPYGFYDIDDSPTKRLVVTGGNDPFLKPFFELATARRPTEELYDVRKDPANLVNLAAKPEYAPVRQRLQKQLEQYLKQTGDARALDGGAVWESYPRYSEIRKFETGN